MAKRVEFNQVGRWRGTALFAKLTGSVIPVTVLGWLLFHTAQIQHLASGWRTAFVVIWLVTFAGLATLWFRQGWTGTNMRRSVRD